MFIPMTNLRGWPAGHDAGLYYNRKGWKALNTLIFAGMDHRIYDIVANAPGSFHDSTIYNLSTMKHYLETRVPRIQVLGNLLKYSDPVPWINLKSYNFEVVGMKKLNVVLSAVFIKIIKYHRMWYEN